MMSIVFKYKYKYKDGKLLSGETWDDYLKFWRYTMLQEFGETGRGDLVN